MDEIAIWNQVFSGQDLRYSEVPVNQGKLFELVKVGFLAKLFPPAPKTILEVGCGTAFVSLYFSKRGYRTTCADINPNVLKIAKGNFKREGAKGNFKQADAEKLPFANDAFDIVTSFGLLEHFPDPVRAIYEMVRVLKPGGVFFADIVPNRFSVQSLGNIFNAVVSLAYWTVRGDPKQGLARAKKNFRPLYFENKLTINEYATLIKAAGIENIYVRGNRPFPRLTLTPRLDKLYARVLQYTLAGWRLFDQKDNWFSRFWGAGLWFWGYKSG